MTYTKQFKSIILGVALTLMASLSYAENYKDDYYSYYPKVKTPTPEGFNKYLVYMGAGTFDPGIPHPDVPGCAELFCDGTYFQEKIMKRNFIEIEQEIADAKEFFMERFGFDVDDGSSNVIMASYMMDPRNEYRAYTIFR